MKQKQLILFLFWAFSMNFAACKKGEIITDPSYGNLTISGNAQVGSKPLFLEVDGKFRDTLKVNEKGAVDASVIIETGERRISILDNDHKKLMDTTFHFKVGKTNVLPAFLYTGSALLLDDLSSKPATSGNVLMRFMSNSNTLPELINIEILLAYMQSGTRKIVAIDKKLSGIRKDKFSAYLEFAAPASLAPAGTTGALYAITATNAATGEVVMNIDIPVVSPNNTYAAFRYALDITKVTFIPNAVVSLAIGDPPNVNTKIRASKALFARIATP